MPQAYFPIAPTGPRPNIPTVINIGHVTRVLADYDLDSNRIFRGGTRTPSKYLPLLLGMEVELLEWAYTYGQRSDTIEFQANYVWALIGNYAGAALRALGNGSGLVINPTTGASLGLERYREDFIIDNTPAARYAFPAGATSYTVPLAGFVIAFMEASGVNEVLGIPTQAGLNNIIYNPSFVRFELNQQVQAGDVFTVWGLRGTNITSVSGGNGLPIPLPLQQGKVLSNTGSQLIWTDVPIEITSADFESDGITYLNSELVNFKFTIFLNDANRFLNATDPPDPSDEFTRISGGGFVINLPGFDASTNLYTLKIFKKGTNA